jgi:hypothetical protein
VAITGGISHTQTLIILLITLVKRDFGTRGKISVSDVFLDAEFKYVSRISVSPTPFAPG